MTDELRVDLFGPVTEQHDQWPTSAGGALRESLALDEPLAVTVDVGADEPFTTDSQLTFLEQRGGELVLIRLQPPAQLQELPAVLDDLETLLDRHGALDGEAQRRIDSWRAGDLAEREAEDAPTPSGALTLGSQVGDAELFASVRPSSSGDGWFYTIALSRPTDQWPRS